MAEYRLTIDGTAVKLGDQVWPVSLEWGYAQARTLTFAVRVGATVQVRFGLEVLLYVDGVVRFRGEVVEFMPDPNYANVRHYVAVDYVDASRDVQVGRFRIGTAAAQLAAAFAWSANKPLAEILDLATQVYGAELLAKKAAPSADQVFAGVHGGTINRFKITNGGFPDFMNAMCSSLPGYTWLWEPDTQLWRIVNVFSAPITTITLEDAVVESNPLTVSVRDRYSKVTILGQAESVTFPDSAYELVPAWDSRLESQWNIDLVTALEDLSDQDDEEMAAVFRRFSFNPGIASIDRDQPIELRHKIRVGVEGGNNIFRWVSVEIAAIDFDRGIIWSKYPCFRVPRRDRAAFVNLKRKGKALPPWSVAIRYWKRIDAPPPYVTAGHGGDLWTKYHMQREYVILEPENDTISQERANMLLAALSAPTVSGTIPLAGDVPDYLWTLNTRLNIRAKSITTGVEDMAAIVTHVRHDFGGPGNTTLTLGTDKSKFMGSALG